MKIGIDIDDTITNSSIVVKEYAYKYDNDYNNRLVPNIDSIMRGFLEDEYVQKFYDEHSKDIGNAIEVKENAKEVIDKLRSEGNQVYIITARSNKFYGDAYAFTEGYLKRHNVNFDKLVTSQTYKLEYCKNEGIDLMIDDAIDTVESINKEGINSILFTSEINKDKETNVRRVNNWLELYEIIHNLNK